MRQKALSLALMICFCLTFIVPAAADEEEGVIFMDDFSGSSLSGAWGHIYGKNSNDISLDTEQKALKYVMAEDDGQIGPQRDFSPNEIRGWGGQLLTVSWKCRAENEGTGVRLNITSDGNELNIFGDAGGAPVPAGEWAEYTVELEFTEVMENADFCLMFKLPGEKNTIYFKDLTIMGKASDYDPAGRAPFEWDNTGKTGKEIGDGNPLFTQRFGADPAWVEYDGRLYVYMTNDTPIYDGDGNIVDNHYGNIKHINVISSADLMNWIDHGSIPVAGAGHVAAWAGNSWAPSVACKEINGKDTFFLYFANGGMGVGVLRGESPIGPWEDPIGKNLVSHSTPNCRSSVVPWCFDPAVFIDDDGTAYLYFGGGVPGTQSANPKSARVVQLGDDMVSIVGTPQEIDAPYFFEAADMVKYGDTYYFSYCSNWQGKLSGDSPGQCQIAYMVSDHPMGPFTYQGMILRNPGDLFGVLYNNNHQSVIQFKDKWYLLYHATLVSDAKGVRNASGGQVNYRSAHMNELFFQPDGTIAEVQGDRKGVPQIATLDPYRRVEAETIAWSSSVKTAMEDPTQLSSLNLIVTGLKNGDWIAVSQADFGTEGALSFVASVHGKQSGTIELRLDSPDGPVVGSVPVNVRNGFETASANIQKVTGVHDVYMLFKGTDGELFDFDWWQFSAAEASNPTQPDEQKDNDPEDDQQPEEPENSEEPNEAVETPEKPGSGMTGWLIAAGAIAVVGGALFLIFRKRGK
ncbi:MAG: glycoside hydrolase family 43 protein [Oscillospiraceae bacterium]|nr:glycoside hydrolase family 43 protein [Oscillospiraceae bacterium]